MFEEEVNTEARQHPKVPAKLKIVYPTSVEFIQELSDEDQQRLVELGWDLSDTIHLGMPYFGAYPPIYEPSFSLLGLVRLLEIGVYFRSVVWNEDYLEDAHDISVEESIQHEKLHITEDAEPRFRKSLAFEKEHKLELGREIKNQSVSHVVDKYGKRAEDILNANGLKRYRRQGEGKTILGDVLTFWLRRYFEKNYDKHKENAIELTSEMKSKRVLESIQASEAEIKKLYKRKFGFTIGD